MFGKSCPKICPVYTLQMVMIIFWPEDQTKGAAIDRDGKDTGGVSEEKDGRIRRSG